MNIYNDLILHDVIINRLYMLMSDFYCQMGNAPTVVNMSTDIYYKIDTENSERLGLSYYCRPTEIFGIKINIINGISGFVSFGYDDFNKNWELCMRGERV